MILQPKNWDQFQHYKDRCPPWIKLHRDLLTDRDFMRLPIASKALAPLLWLMASESKDGTFDGSLDELVFRLHITEKEYQDGLKPLLDKGFFIVASGVLADRLQHAIPERETEKETKKEKKATDVATPIGVSLDVWLEFVAHRKSKKAKVTELVLQGLIKEAEKAGWSLEEVLKEIVVRNWQSFKADWVQPRQGGLVNKFDVANVTTPTPKNYDAALRKIEEDAKKAVKPNADVQAKIAELLKEKAK